ncbi:hypothetical protein LPJ73_004568, partial [Coemansia sp. RSA 2703]
MQGTPQQEPAEIPTFSRASSVASAPSTLAESLRSYWESRRIPARRPTGTSHNLIRSLHRAPNSAYRASSILGRRGFVNSSAKVNAAVARLVSLIMRDFIQEWYEKITDDKEFLSEVNTQLMLVVNEIELRCRKVDW